jgi:hypothetical protein
MNANMSIYLALLWNIRPKTLIISVIFPVESIKVPFHIQFHPI